MLLLAQADGKRPRDIIVTHIDTLANDWSQLFENVVSLPSSYLASSCGRGVYAHGSAKSFFEQVAPSNSVALAYSGGQAIRSSCRNSDF